MDIDSKIINYLEGSLSDHEIDEFLLWLEESPENKAYYFEKKDIWDSYRIFTDEDVKGQNEVWSKLESMIQSEDKHRRLNINLMSWIKVAAVILFAFSLGWGSKYISDSSNVEKQYSNQLIVPKGQRSKLLLADGSEVWLNSDSRLTFSIDANSKERLVSLDGEAYFNVAHDKNHPFIVNVSGQRLKVLGTKFNVRSYSNEGTVFTTLEEGSVEINAGGQKVILEPMQQLKFDRKLNSVSLSKVNTNYYTVWRDGRYIFDNEKFSNIIQMVERWYDVKFIYSEEVFNEMHFSGVIKRSLPIEHVLKLINHTTPIEVKIKDDVISMRLRK